MDFCCNSTPSPAMPSQQDLSERARIFKVLGDASRLWLLHRLLEGEVCVCDLLTELPLSQATLSHHLRVLSEADLVSSRKSGRWNFYQTTARGRTLVGTVLSSHSA